MNVSRADKRELVKQFTHCYGWFSYVSEVVDFVSGCPVPPIWLKYRGKNSMVCPDFFATGKAGEFELDEYFSPGVTTRPTRGVGLMRSGSAVGERPRQLVQEE